MSVSPNDMAALTHSYFDTLVVLPLLVGGTGLFQIRLKLFKQYSSHCHTCLMLSHHIAFFVYFLRLVNPDLCLFTLNRR